MNVKVVGELKRILENNLGNTLTPELATGMLTLFSAALPPAPTGKEVEPIPELEDVLGSQE